MAATFNEYIENYTSHVTGLSCRIETGFVWCLFRAEHDDIMMCHCCGIYCCWLESGDCLSFLFWTNATAIYITL